MSPACIIRSKEPWIPYINFSDSFSLGERGCLGSKVKLIWFSKNLNLFPHLNGISRFGKMPPYLAGDVVCRDKIKMIHTQKHSGACRELPPQQINEMSIVHTGRLCEFKEEGCAPPPHPLLPSHLDNTSPARGSALHLPGDLI